MLELILNCHYYYHYYYYFYNYYCYHHLFLGINTFIVLIIIIITSIIVIIIIIIILITVHFQTNSCINIIYRADHMCIGDQPCWMSKETHPVFAISTTFGNIFSSMSCLSVTSSSNIVFALSKSILSKSFKSMVKVLMN